MTSISIKEPLSYLALSNTIRSSVATWGKTLANDVAINNKLKSGKERFWFGNVTPGGGSAPDEKLFLLQPKLFYYSPKYSINFIGDFNNIGEVALSRRDIRGFTGGARQPSRQLTLALGCSS